MNILWIDLNSSYAHSSLALPALHAQLLDRTDIEWNIVSATINEQPGAIVEKACQYHPDIIAATTWLFNHEALMHVCSRLKALFPKACLILGGPEFLGENEAFLRRNPFVDVVFRGEGEREFPKWLEYWNQPSHWTGIQGLCYLDANHTYQDQGLARVLDYDQLTLPEESPFYNWSKPFVQLETTRGCFNTCAFCVSGGEKPVRTLSIETIAKRVKTIYEHGIKDVRVLDRTFNFNPQRAKGLLEIFRQYAPKMRFHLEVHPALMKDELKEELKTMPKGLLHLEAGIQSLHEPVLELCKRLGTLEKAMQGLQFLCNLPNMITHADLIAGLPLYHLEEIFDDIQVLASYKVGEIQLESLKLLPGTYMRNHAEELGICYSPFPPYEVLRTNEISVEELQTARLLSRLLDDYYNTDAWQDVTRDLMLADPLFIKKFLKHLTDINLIDQPMSLEKRGLLLYDFCKQNYPDFVTKVSIAWIEAGMSLKKQPAEHVKTKHQTPPSSWNTLYGSYRENLRLCFLPAENGHGYWFGFETEIQKITPSFKAFS